jgi:hypothetical protein
MSQKMISRRGALSLLGITAALGFAVPTTALTTSSAQAQGQAAPTAPPLRQCPVWNGVNSGARRGNLLARCGARRGEQRAKCGVRRGKQRAKCGVKRGKRVAICGVKRGAETVSSI